MKKNNIFYMCAAAALVMVSCQKGEDNPQQTDSVPVYLETIEAVSPSVPVRTMTNDGVNILWQDGDRIGLRPYTEGTASANGIMVEYETDLSSPLASATFVRVEGEEDPVALRNGIYIALYPSDPAYNNWSGQYDRTRVGIPYNQILPAGGGFYRKSSLMIATAAEGESLRFKHAMAYINFVVDSASPAFDRLVISSNSGTVLTDRIDLYYDATYEISSNGNYKSTSVTVTTEQASAFTPGSYYAAILPQTYAGGFTFAFYNEGELVGTKSIDTDVTFARGDVAQLGTIGTFGSLPDPLETVTVYEENGVKQGIVFWVDPANPYKGKVISKCAGKLAFETAANAYIGARDETDGLANYNTIVSSERYIASPSSFPAVYYCAGLRESLGGNWRLPTLSEMQALHNLYYGLGDQALSNNTEYRTDESMTSKRIFDEALVLLGETEFNTLDGDSDYDKVCDNAGFGTANGVTYMLGRENSDGKAQTARLGKYTNSSSARTTTNYVRCVRDVEIN